MTQKLTVSALVRNRSGVLLRVAGLFAERQERAEFQRLCAACDVRPSWRDFLRAADIIYEASRFPRPSIPSSRE